MKRSFTFKLISEKSELRITNRKCIYFYKGAGCNIAVGALNPKIPQAKVYLYLAESATPIILCDDADKGRFFFNKTKIRFKISWNIHDFN